MLFRSIVGLRASSPGCSWRRGGKRKERLQLRLWIEYLHGKSRCKMLIGRDDSNNVITLGICFAMFVYIHGCFHFVLIGGNMTSQSTGWHRGMDVEFKFKRRSCKLSPLFPPRCQSNPESLLTGYIIVLF